MNDWKKRLEKKGWRVTVHGRWVNDRHPSGLTIGGSSFDWGYTMREALVRAGLKMAG